MGKSIEFEVEYQFTGTTGWTKWPGANFDSVDEAKDFAERISQKRGVNTKVVRFVSKVDTITHYLQGQS